MFKHFKEAVLASRIRKAAVPSKELYNEASDMYVDMITSIMGLSKKVVEEVAYLAGKHADEIAKAIVLLEPVIKDIQRHEGFKQLSKELESLTETLVSSRQKSFEDKLDAVKEALKANE